LEEENARNPLGEGILNSREEALKRADFLISGTAKPQNESFSFSSALLFK